nr:DUF429 domain-containing protein [candidate division KSB1 bacterium]NIR69893.1 DUF429 domain-containing protein [candidate division KSB1 bacterium]NIS28046.1 DUF429 domain-containing protein [candidate division KSB1 bacterium]NIT74917.1 DUF429 domain-containing protein [candidate division KSB1 bacterium]NIU28701.1 DUF429 domain-containing protein [candidate division KSB1 bacterium]
GKKLSKQTWNICRKMAEVDLFLRENKEARAQFREAHPELCFWALASGHPMTHPKRSYQGHRERMRLLRKVDPSFERLLHSTLSEYPRREVAADDVLDALVLAVAATGQLGELKSLPAEPEWDEEGLPMEIVFPDNQSHQPEIEG